ncbi:DUF302 domain-containing protein [Pelagibius litoralis]|uniref:DUF302 domain-containing protein n=1 Tax=Pelagibius litoralis TaxID=374515 RepID=A0A967F2S6_9PROT|nr:DUF302 domain-containing protein [Pelagibius litoralis]
MALFAAPLIGGPLALSASAEAADGLIVKKSSHSVSDTIDRLEAILKEKGLTVFAKVDHQAGAQKAGLELRPTMLLIFGNPKLGTPLMQSGQSIAIDLPQKALAYEDAAGDVYLAYNDPAYLSGRHAIADRAEVFKKITGALGAFTDAAVK